MARLDCTIVPDPAGGGPRGARGLLAEPELPANEILGPGGMVNIH